MADIVAGETASEAQRWVAERCAGDHSGFGAFRRTRILIAGAGSLPLACVHTLLSLDIDRVDVFSQGTSLQRMRAVAEAAGKAARLSVIERPVDEVLAADSNRYDVILLSADDVPGCLAMWDRGAHAAPEVLVLVMAAGPACGVLGPLPGAVGLTCRQCARTILHGALADTLARAPARADLLPAGPPVIGYLGACAALAVLRHRAGLPREIYNSSFVLVNTDTLTQSAISVPRCGGCHDGPRD